MKKKKWNRVLAVLLMMVMSISLLSGCGGKSTEKEDAETITVYLWSTNLYEKYAPYIQEQLPDINVEFVVGNNDLDFYKFLKENGGLPDIITCCRFSLHDASPLKDSLMDLSTTNMAGAVYDTYLSNFMNEDGSVNWLPVCADAHGFIVNKDLFEKYDIIILGERDHRDMSQYQFVSEIISDRRFIQNVGHIFTEIGATNQTERANNILGSEYESYLDFEKDLMELYRDLSSSYIWEKYNYWYLLSAIYRINTSLNDNQNLTLHFTDINFDWNNYFDINAYTDIYSRDSIMGCNFINEFDKILQNQDEPRKKALVILTVATVSGIIPKLLGGNQQLRFFLNTIPNELPML